MAFAIARIAKLKGGSIKASGQHNDRSRETPNADPVREDENRVLDALLDSAMILFDQVVQVLARPHLCALRKDFFSLQLTDRSVSRRIAINGDLLR